MPFLIDGYNVYHAAIKLSEQWAHITPLTLCRFIAQDMQNLRDAAVVVFDGRQLRGQNLEVAPVGFVKIIFSGPKSDADTRLEDLIKQNTAPRRLTVVSSDNQVRRAARRRRTKMLKAIEYLVEMLQRSEQPPRIPNEPAQKRRGLNENESAEWLKLFGLDPNKTKEDADHG